MEQSPQQQTEHQHLVDSRKKLIFLILILGGVIAIGPLTIDMYLPAFSAIAQSLDASESLVQLSLTTYFIGIALGQLAYGPIIDRFGKKPPLFFGLSLFIISSIACLFVKNIEQLIFWRFFQALGACAGAVVPRSIVRDIFSPQESGRVFSHLMLVMGIAPILAPVFGSFILALYGWKAIFVFLTCFGFICLAVSYFIIPETKGANPDEKMSNAFKKYLGILRDKNFVVATLCGGLTMAGIFSYITGAPFSYLTFFGLSAKEFSLLFSINSIFFIIASQINARLLRKYSMEKVLEKVLLIPAIAGIALVFCGFYDHGFMPITLSLSLYLFSVGAILPSSSALAMANQSVHSGSASALLGTIQFILAAITSFLVGKLNNGDPSAMCLIVGSCGILAFLVYKLFK